VLLKPSLQDIQKAINRAAIAVMRSSKELFNWDITNGQSSIYDMIA